MSKRRQTSKKSGGSTLFGVLLGLIIGLAAAAAVAWFVTQVPMPFFDKASRDPAQTLLPDLRDAPDPNIGMYARPDANGPVDHTIEPPAGAPGSRPDMSDDIAKLLSNLETSKGISTENSASTSGTTGQAAAGASSSSTPPSSATVYLLQAGAFRSQPDAEAMKARILMLGMTSHVEKGESNGSDIYRVRVGPFNGIDEMNQARVRLGEAKIESTVVRR